VKRASIALPLLVGALACSGEHPQQRRADTIAANVPPPRIDSSRSAPAAPSAPPSCLDTTATDSTTFITVDTTTPRVDRIGYCLLYNFGATSADLVAHNDSVLTAATRSPADSALVQVLVFGRPGATTGDVVLDFSSFGNHGSRQSPLGTLDSTGHRIFSYRVPQPQMECDSVALAAYVRQGALRIGGQTAEVPFHLQCGE